MNKVVKIFAIAVSIMLVGCATSIPVTSNINDFVLMGIKTNNNEKVDFVYSSKIIDGKIKAYTKDKAELADGPGYEHTEASSMKKMLSEFMGNKFPNMSKEGTTKVKISFEEFHIEQFTEESATKQFLTGMFGGKSDYILIAKVKVMVIVSRNGQDQTKIITGSSEDRYTAITTSKGGVYDKNDSVEGTHGKNINNANNKVLMLLNAYFLEIGL